MIYWNLSPTTWRFDHHGLIHKCTLIYSCTTMGQPFTNLYVTLNNESLPTFKSSKMNDRKSTILLLGKMAKNLITTVPIRTHQFPTGNHHLTGLRWNTVYLYKCTMAAVVVSWCHSHCKSCNSCPQWTTLSIFTESV